MQGKRGAGARVAQEKKCEESLPKRTFPLKYVLRIVSLCLNYVRCKRRHDSVIEVMRARSALTQCPSFLKFLLDFLNYS